MTVSAGTALIAHPGAELYGSDRVMLETVSALVERNWRVLVTTPVDGPLLAEARRRGAETLIAATPVLRKSALHPAGLLRLAVDAGAAVARSAALLRRLRPDVVYVSTVTVPTWLLAAALARAPSIAHLHEAERGAPRLVRTGLLLPLLLARRTIVNSRFSLTTAAADLPPITGRATIIYNGVPGPAAVSGPRDSLDEIRVLYVGRVSERKGVHVAVEAVAALRASGTPATLDIAGAVFPGYEEYEARLRARVAKLGLEDAVRFLGFQESVWPLLAAADIAVVPSIVDEPFGNTAVEAVLAARPVVVSRSGGLPEAVEGLRSAHIVSPNDAAELADAISAIVHGWTGERRQATTDSAAAAERFSSQHYRRRVAEEIRTVAAGRRNAAHLRRRSHPQP